MPMPTKIHATLSAGMHALPPGHVAEIVTYLEMASPVTLDAPKPLASLRIEPWLEVDHADYLALFRKVGTPWLWSGRLDQTTDDLRAVFDDADYHVFRLMDQDEPVGLLDLDFRKKPDCEIAYFGMALSHIGQGVGRWFMSEALTLAWRDDVHRVWLHTCTFDHPKALGFYQKCGFKPFLRHVGIGPDPRMAGLLDSQVAPQVPML